MPESVRWLVSKGRTEEARFVKLIVRSAKLNGNYI